jgi:hypothetical protein
MPADMEPWIAGVPEATFGCEGDGLCVEGLLLRAGNDRIRLLINNLCLELNSADVISVKEISDDEGSQPHFGIHVMLLLKKGAHLLDIFSGEHLANFWTGRRPFSLSARSSPRELRSSPKFRALEKSFLEQRRLKLP